MSSRRSGVSIALSSLIAIWLVSTACESDRLCTLVYCESYVAAVLTSDVAFPELVGGHVRSCLNGTCAERSIVPSEDGRYACAADQAPPGISCGVERANGTPIRFHVRQVLGRRPAEGDRYAVTIFGPAKSEPIAHAEGAVRYTLEATGGRNCGDDCYAGTLGE